MALSKELNGVSGAELCGNAVDVTVKLGNSCALGRRIGLLAKVGGHLVKLKLLGEDPFRVIRLRARANIHNVAREAVSATLGCLAVKLSSEVVEELLLNRRAADGAGALVGRSNGVRVVENWPPLPEKEGRGQYHRHSVPTRSGARQCSSDCGYEGKALGKCV
jgi:hypothetical protein